MTVTRKDALTAWREAPEGQSVREFIARNYGRRLSSGGEIISLMFWVIDHCRSEAYWRAWRGYRAGSGQCSVGEHHETVKLTPQTEIQISAFCWEMPACIPNRRRLYFSVNGRRCSRDSAMTHARSAWEGTYQFEREMICHA